MKMIPTVIARVVLRLLVLLSITSLSAFPVSAHVLQSDGTVGAVLHIDPNDSPVTGEASTFFFEFKDTKNAFRLEECMCTATVFADKTSVFSTALTTLPLFRYTFSTPNIYTVTVHGVSSTNSFTPFTLSYTIRVERGTSAPSQPSTLLSFFYHSLHYTVFALGFLVLIILVIREKRSKIKKE